jgi:arylsulfatase A-like enzyme
MKKVFFIAAFFLIELLSAESRPNILFIAIDDLRPELGCYGKKEVLSPHIDKLASTGTVFNRAYCQVAVCGASRASLMTGLRPTWQRFVKYNTISDKDAPGVLTLPQELKQKGYHCLSNGKIFHHKDDTAERSWSENPWKPDMKGSDFLDPKSKSMILAKNKRGPVLESPDVPDNAYPDGQIADKTIADLKRLAKQGKPFFMACGFMKPHLPFYAPKKYWDLYDRASLILADNQARPQNAPEVLAGSKEILNYHDRGMEYNQEQWHRACLHGYYACVSYIDAQVGRLISTLDNLGLRKNTIVIVWGDHGWHLGEHTFWGKHNLMHLSSRSPLILSIPGGRKNQTCDRLVEFVDIYPTLLDLAGITPENEGLEGTSFKILLQRPRTLWKKAAFSRYGPAISAITPKFNYVQYKSGEKMLFDLISDPDENINIAGDPKRKSTLNHHIKILGNGWTDALPPSVQK